LLLLFLYAKEVQIKMARPVGGDVRHLESRDDVKQTNFSSDSHDTVSTYVRM
jgi:hypothetical protein